MYVRYFNRSYVEMGDFARVMAFHTIVIFLACTALGSTLPEFGNVVANRLGIWAHSFNTLFLILGILGISLALYLGYQSRG